MGTRPTHKVLAVSERPDANGAVKSFYTKIGVAWPIKNGAGLSIKLEALPINNRLIVTEISDEDERASSLPTAPESTS